MTSPTSTAASSSPPRGRSGWPARPARIAPPDGAATPAVACRGGPRAGRWAAGAGAARPVGRGTDDRGGGVHTAGSRWREPPRHGHVRGRERLGHRPARALERRRGSTRRAGPAVGALRRRAAGRGHGSCRRPRSRPRSRPTAHRSGSSSARAPATAGRWRPTAPRWVHASSSTGTPTAGSSRPTALAPSPCTSGGRPSAWCGRAWRSPGWRSVGCVLVLVRAPTGGGPVAAGPPRAPLAGSARHAVAGPCRRGHGRGGGDCAPRRHPRRRHRGGSLTVAPAWSRAAAWPWSWWSPRGARGQPGAHRAAVAGVARPCRRSPPISCSAAATEASRAGGDLHRERRGVEASTATPGGRGTPPAGSGRPGAAPRRIRRRPGTPSAAARRGRLRRAGSVAEGDHHLAPRRRTRSADAPARRR